MSDVINAKLVINVLARRSQTAYLSSVHIVGKPKYAPYTSLVRSQN